MAVAGARTGPPRHDRRVLLTWSWPLLTFGVRLHGRMDQQTGGRGAAGPGANMLRAAPHPVSTGNHTMGDLMQDFFLFRSLLDAFAAHGPVMQIAWLVSPVPLLWLALAQHLRLRAENCPAHEPALLCVVRETTNTATPNPPTSPNPRNPARPRTGTPRLMNRPVKRCGKQFAQKKGSMRKGTMRRGAMRKGAGKNGARAARLRTRCCRTPGLPRTPAARIPPPNQQTGSHAEL